MKKMSSLPLYGFLLVFGLVSFNFPSVAQIPATPASPANVTSGDVYDLTINDTAMVRGVQSLSSGVLQVNFAIGALDVLAANYTILQFERLYPHSRFSHIRNLWRVQTTGNTLQFINDLHNAARQVFL